jgi:hypothetical protein
VSTCNLIGDRFEFIWSEKGFKYWIENRASMGTVAHFNKRCPHCESRLPKWICACLHSRRADVVPHCNDVNVRVGWRYIVLAKMSHMRRRVRTGFRCAATCRELTPPFGHYWLYWQYWVICNNVGGNQSPRRKPTLSKRVALYHMRNGFDQDSGASEVIGTWSFPCATLKAQGSGV